MNTKNKMSEYLNYLLLFSASTDNILPITSVCNVSCLFCSNRHNPPSVRTYRLPPLSFEKVAELVNYLDPRRKIIMGESASRIDEGEPFTHPEMIRILRYIRKKFPQTLIQITSNGSLLDEPTVTQLAQISGIELNISLNSAALANRRRLMRDPRAETAVACPEILAQYKIPYHGSIVGMPHLVGWDDIAATCRFLDRNHAQSIRLFVPGFTQFAPQECRYPVEMIGGFFAQTQLLAGRLTCPLTLEPYVPENFSAVIEGVIPGSEAERSGLVRGDIVLAVDNVPVRSRIDAFRLMVNGSNPVLAVERGAAVISVRLNKAAGIRPGTVMYADLDWSLADEIRSITARKKAASVAVLTSSLAYPAWAKALAALPEISVKEVPNRFFGGSIRAAGLLVTEDYQATLTELSLYRHPDAVFVPAISYDPRGFDLCGVSYLNLSCNEAEIVLL